MRILFITAFYPPHVVGGWEQLVQDINHRLQARGHTTHVLTSTYGVNDISREAGVDRLLTLESDLHHYNPRHFLGHKQRLKQNLAHTAETITTFQPDVIFIHVMWNLSRGIAWLAEKEYPGRVVYYVANDWPHAPDAHTAYWQDPAHNPVLKIAKNLLAPVALNIIRQENETFTLDFEHVLCVSQAVKNDLAQNAGITPEQMQVVYNGVETELFLPPAGWNDPPNGRRELSLLYAGSLNTHKGVHTAIEAMAELARQNNLAGLTLNLVGSGHPDYEARLHQLVANHNLGEAVHFLGRVPRQEMPALLQQHQVLIFPSIWEEPLARMMQEAMAAGLVVVGTLTGGSGELLVEGETGLTFAPEDSATLAHRLAQLRDDPHLWLRLAQTGREAVLQRFDLNRMIDEIESYLATVPRRPA